jgi:hypothetical protein
MAAGKERERAKQNPCDSIHLITHKAGISLHSCRGGAGNKKGASAPGRAVLERLGQTSFCHSQLMTKGTINHIPENARANKKIFCS